MSVKALENKMALPTKDWGINDQSDLYEDESGRQVANFVIGVNLNPNNEVVGYIQEPIYTDLVTALQSGQKGFSTLININQVPPVIIRYDKQVLIHNDQVVKHIENIKNALDDIPTDVIISSLAELRIKKASRRKADEIRVLEYMVKSKTNISYNNGLIEYVVRNLIYGAMEDKLGINDMLQKMSQDESIRFIGAVMEYTLTESTSDERLAALLENHNIEDIEETLNRAITYKYFLDLL